MAKNKKRTARKKTRSGKKRAGPRPKTARQKANKRRPRSKNMAKKQRRSKKSLVGGGIKQVAKGGIAGQAVELIVKRIGGNGLSVDAGYVTSAMVAGKAGVIGNAAARQILTRVGNPLSFLGGSSGSSSAQTSSFQGGA